ncbi:PD-(D/E)XK nuclease family protein [Streptomyces sp. NPDC002248]
MLKTFRRCPKQADYKYFQRLKPKTVSKPLKRGTWLHYLLEEYHMGRDWEAKHRQLCGEYNQLFDEEKDFYGDLPRECLQIMKSYIWHYKDDPWKILEAEFTLETEFPDGTLFRGRVDALVENHLGLWLVDHKSHRTLPDHSFRVLDTQSALYLWAALRNKLQVQGFIWNYLKTKPAAKPHLLKSGARLSKKLGETDYPTYARELKRLQAEEGYRITREDVELGNKLKAMRYRHGEPQLSPFFRREVLEKDPAMLKRVAQENYHTSKRMNSYPFENEAIVERNPSRNCTFDCSYTALCEVELIGGNPQYLRRSSFKVGDPNSHYQEAREPSND